MNSSDMKIVKVNTCTENMRNGVAETGFEHCITNLLTK
jgi:hypothetical protein